MKNFTMSFGKIICVMTAVLCSQVVLAADFDFKKASVGQDCRDGLKSISNNGFEVKWEKSNKSRRLCSGSIPFKLDAGKAVEIQEVVIESASAIEGLNFDFEMFLTGKKSERVKLQKSRLGKSESLKAALESLKTECGGQGLLRWNVSAFGSAAIGEIAAMRVTYIVVDCP